MCSIKYLSNTRLTQGISGVGRFERSLGIASVVALYNLLVLFCLLLDIANF